MSLSVDFPLATCLASLPMMFLRSGLAPSLMSELMQTRLSVCAARCSGVAELKSVLFKLQPPLDRATMDSSTWFVELS